MDDSTAWVRLMQAVYGDEYLTVWHICLLVAILYLWLNNDCKNPVPVTRRKLMKLSRIRSIATYHKCIKDLVVLGYLRYQPSYHPKGSWMYLTR